MYMASLLLMDILGFSSLFHLHKKKNAKINFGLQSLQRGMHLADGFLEVD